MKKLWFLLFCLLLSGVAQAQSLNFNANSNPLPYATPLTISWSASGLTNCDAGLNPNSWGLELSIPTSGSETLSVFGSKNPSYTITCGNNTGSATLNWTPTTDTTAMGYMILVCDNNQLIMCQVIGLSGASTDTYTVTGLTTGVTYYFVVITQDQSGAITPYNEWKTIQYTVPGTSVTKTLSINILNSTVPNPPTKPNVKT